MNTHKPRISILANLHFYTFGAMALQKEGLLHRYIFSIGITKSNKWLIALLPTQLRRKMVTRDISEISGDKVRSLWLPELLQRVLPVIRLISYERSNWLDSYLFDWYASFYIDRCDIFHFVNGVGLYSAKKAKHKGAILVCDMRAEHPDFQYEILKDEYKKLDLEPIQPFLLIRDRLCQEYALADYFIVPSTYAKSTYVKAGLGEKKIFVVPYGVDFKNFDKIRDKSNEGVLTKSRDIFRIIYVGQLCVRKGIHYLIDAFKALNIRNKELLLVGDYSENIYRSYIENTVNQDWKIKHIGQVAKIDLVYYYNISSVFVLPSLANSFGLVTLEAMACGLPVIVTENSGSSEVVRDDVDGYVIPIRNTSVLLSKLEYLGNNREIRERMGTAAYFQARKYTWTRYADQLLQVYDEILNMQS